jgi:hypothetical protein
MEEEELTIWYDSFEQFRREIILLLSFHHRIFTIQPRSETFVTVVEVESDRSWVSRHRRVRFRNSQRKQDLEALYPVRWQSDG